VRQLTQPGEVERQRLVPALVGRVRRQRPAAAGAVDQDLDLAQGAHRLVADALRRFRLHDVGDDNRRADAAALLDSGSDLLEQILAARHDRQPRAFRREPGGDGAADAHAGAGDQRSSPFQLQIHSALYSMTRSPLRTGAVSAA
jgi:hypothetical protein